MSSEAKPVKAMISPTLISPRTTSRAPMIRTIIIETVEAMRWSALASAHQSSTGYCAAISRRACSRSVRVSSPMRVKLCTTATLPMESLTWAKTR